VIFTKIYYKINYHANFQDFESIIEKSELFDYERYCKYRTYRGGGKVYNLSRSVYYHIDRDFIDSLKLAINKDKEKFHFYPFFGHSFIYSLEVSNESLVFLTYNNNSKVFY